MYSDTFITNPADEYEATYLPSFRKKIEDAYQLVVSRSGVDPEENRKQIEQYEKLEAERGKSEQREVVLWLEIILGSCAIVSLGAFLCWEIDDQYMDALWMVPVIVAGLAAFITLVWKMAPKLKYQMGISRQLANQSVTIKQEEASRLAGIIEGLNDEDLMQMVIDTIPPLQPDPYMTDKRSRNLKESFGYAGTEGREKETIVEMMSGDLGASPFSFERRRRVEMVNKTYSNSITINWTTTEEYTDEEGNKKTREVEHSQTLEESVTRPKPVYPAEWQLNVMSDRAGSVSFSRKPPLWKGIKSLAFRKLDSEDFEKSFKVKNLEGDRVEFGVMFDFLTVKALQSLQLDKKNGFGDDFSMKKTGSVLTVTEKHLDDFTMNVFMNEYEGYFSLEKIKKTFELQSEKYFQKLYYAFAPVFAISMYQRFEPTTDSGRGAADVSRPADGEMERIINELSNTKECISKIHAVEENELWSEVTADIHLFYCEHCCEVFSVRGGDGKYHDIPVYYDEYTPYVEQEKYIVACTNFTDELTQADLSYLQTHHNYRYDKKRQILSIRTRKFSKEDERRLKELLGNHSDAHQ